MLKIRDFLKYGFTDEENSFLGSDKFDKNQGKNDGKLCVLAYAYWHNVNAEDCDKISLEKFDMDLHKEITDKIEKSYNGNMNENDKIRKDALEKSSYSLVRDMHPHKNSLEKSSYSLVKRKVEGKQ